MSVPIQSGHHVGGPGERSYSTGGRTQHLKFDLGEIKMGLTVANKVCCCWTQWKHNKYLIFDTIIMGCICGFRIVIGVQSV